MPTTYNIYLVNKMSTSQNFWLFLSSPIVGPAGTVFANSEICVEVDSNYGGLTSFSVPFQYVLGAGACNQAVGLGVQVTTNMVENVSLGDTWNATYANVPPMKGPLLTLASNSPGNSVTVVNNGYDQPQNQAHNWHENQSFGVQTAAGFTGFTWSPSPGQTTTITPTLTFYVSNGSFSQNSLALMTTVSTNAATISTLTDFDLLNNCTVTVDGEGQFSVSPGMPSTVTLIDEFGRKEALLASSLLSGGNQIDQVVSVHIYTAETETRGFRGQITNPSGTLTVKTALTAAFAAFLLAGTKFKITSDSSGQTSVTFSYSGPLSVNAVKALFTAGASATFTGNRS